MDSGWEKKTDNCITMSREEANCWRNMRSSEFRSQAKTGASSNYRFNVLLTKTQTFTHISRYGQVVIKAESPAPSRKPGSLARISINKSASLVTKVIQGLPDTDIRVLGETLPDSDHSSVKTIMIGLLRNCMGDSDATLGAPLAAKQTTCKATVPQKTYSPPQNKLQDSPTKRKIHIPIVIFDRAEHPALIPLLKTSKTKRKSCEQLCLQRFKKLVDCEAGCAVIAVLAGSDSFLQKLSCMCHKYLPHLISKESGANLLTYLLPKFNNENHLNEILSVLRAQPVDQQFVERVASVVFNFIYHDMLQALEPLSDLVSDHLELFIDSRSGWPTVVLLFCRTNLKALDVFESIAKSSPMKMFDSENWRAVFFFFLLLGHRQHPGHRNPYDSIVRAILSSESCLSSILRDDFSGWLFIHLCSLTDFNLENCEQGLSSMSHTFGGDSSVRGLSSVLRRVLQIHQSQQRRSLVVP